MKALRLKTYRFFLLTVILLGVLSPAPRPVEAALSMPANFITETVIDGLTSPTTIAFAPDGRIFIGLKSGVVRVFQNGVLLPTPFNDITSQENN
jgi:glucose/arabinose dehydrogenase